MKLLTLQVGPYQVQTPGQISRIDTLSLQNIVSFAINTLLTVAILLTFFFVLFAGLRWMLSQGDKKQVEEAQKTLTYAVIGLVLVLLSFFILNLVGFVFRVHLLGN